MIRPTLANLTMACPERNAPAPKTSAAVSEVPVMTGVPLSNPVSSAPFWLTEPARARGGCTAGKAPSGSPKS
jgi:hypothetical protein